MITRISDGTTVVATLYPSQLTADEESLVRWFVVERIGLAATCRVEPPPDIDLGWITQLRLAACAATAA